MRLSRVLKVLAVIVWASFGAWLAGCSPGPITWRMGVNPASTSGAAEGSTP